MNLNYGYSYGSCWNCGFGELWLRFLFAWLTMACKDLPDSFRFMSVKRIFEIMIIDILIYSFPYVLLLLLDLGAPSAWKNRQSLSSCGLIVLSPLPLLAPSTMFAIVLYSWRLDSSYWENQISGNYSCILDSP